jgi:hypothetical protein
MIDAKDFEAICLANGMMKSAVQDAFAQFPDDGTAASEWVPQQRATKPHWFRQPADDSLPELYSLTAQSAHVKAHGEAETRALLAANGLKLGEIKAAPKVDEKTIKVADNPYSHQSRLTPAERQKKIASMIRSMPTHAVASIAKAAGKKIDGTPLNKR